MAQTGPQISPSIDLSTTTLGKDIANFSQGQSMFFVLQSGERLEFLRNPIDIQQQRDPVEASFPTKAGWYVFRWMNQPTMWTIRVYAGRQGRDIEGLLDKLEGQVNVTWICPYVLGAGGQVRIISVQRPKSNQAPFSIYYTITMQNMQTNVFGNLGQIIPNRVTSAFVSPSIGVGFNNIANIASVAIRSNWTGFSDVATFLNQNNLSSLSIDNLISSLQQLNPNVQDPWKNNPLAPSPPISLRYAKS